MLGLCTYACTCTYLLTHTCTYVYPLFQTWSWTFVSTGLKPKLSAKVALAELCTYRFNSYKVIKHKMGRVYLTPSKKVRWLYETWAFYEIKEIGMHLALLYCLLTSTLVITISKHFVGSERQKNAKSMVRKLRQTPDNYLVELVIVVQSVSQFQLCKHYLVNFPNVR